MFSPENKQIVTLVECEYLIGLQKQKLSIEEEKYS